MGLYKWFTSGNRNDFLEDDSDFDLGIIEFNTFTCDRCGTSFVLSDAISEFENHFNYDLTYEDFREKLCGDCAIKEIESKIPTKYR